VDIAAADWIGLPKLLPAGAFGVGSGASRKRAARRWAAKLGPGLAEKRGAAWFVSPAARLPDGRTVEAFVKVGAKPETLNGFRLPPGAVDWGEPERQRFLDTHEYKRKVVRAGEQHPGMTFGGLVAIVAREDGAWLRSRNLSSNPDRVRIYFRRIDPRDRLFDGNALPRGRPPGAGAGKFKRILEWIEAQYLQPNQRRVAPIWREAKLIAKRDGLPCPSLRTAQG